MGALAGNALEVEDGRGLPAMAMSTQVMTRSLSTGYRLAVLPFNYMQRRRNAAACPLGKTCPSSLTSRVFPLLSPPLHPPNISPIPLLDAHPRLQLHFHVHVDQHNRKHVPSHIRLPIKIPKHRAVGPGSDGCSPNPRGPLTTGLQCLHS